MHCPYCNEEDTRVIDSRLVGEGNQVRRRRECTGCHERFTTYERAELNLPRIVKGDERREPFNEDKLRSGMMHALEKRPVQTDLIEDVVAHVKHKLLATGEREVDSRTIGEWVMTELLKIDKVAYVRFASVYRSFEDVRAFLDEIERVENELPPDLRKDQMTLLPNDKP